MTYYKRNLPHYQPEGHTFFVTIRLAGTIPENVFQRIKGEFEAEISKFNSLNVTKKRRDRHNEIQINRFMKYEQILDSHIHGRIWLADERTAEIVADSLHYRDGKEIDLIAYTIMPNHVHIVLKPIVERFAESLTENIKNESDNGRNLDSLFILTEILQNYKKYTARKSNIILKRTGQFWQHESYDHVVRDQDELNRIINYVLHNPVKAGLVEKPEDWKWSYYKRDFEL